MSATSAYAGATTSCDALPGSGDRSVVDRALEDALRSARRKYATNPHVEPVYERTCEFVLRGGKRVRPRLCLASFRALAGREPGAAEVVAAASLELFHAFMLVHDDLIDGSLTRRERPTLHEAIREGSDRPGDAKASCDLALLGGDWLFALGLRMVARAGLEPGVGARANRFLADMLFETGVGEALDVLYETRPLAELTEGQVVEMYLRKTSRYSVSGPLILGAILAGAATRACRALGRFGDVLGLAYQIRNDLDALQGDPARPCDDLDTGKRTYVLWTAHRRLDAAGRRRLDAALAMPAGVERRRELLDLIHESGAYEACRQKLASLQRDAAEALRTTALTGEQRRVLVDLAGWLAGSPLAVPAAMAS